MNQKGSTLSLTGTGARGAKLAESQTFKVVLGLGLLLIVAATLYLSMTTFLSAKPAESAVVAGADSARWTAMGEHYGKLAFDAERSAAVSATRWTAMGKHYGKLAFDAERSAVVSATRWTAMGEHYRGLASDSERVSAVSSARWNAMGLRYTGTDIVAARYQAMGEWYTR